jgi:hypothetical protein
MIICPAIVPTAELDTPDASSDNKNTPAAAIPVSCMEGARRHHHHGHVHHAGDRKRNDHLCVRDAHHPALSAFVASWNARLGKAGVQINGMRHHRCTDDADG